MRSFFPPFIPALCCKHKAFVIVVYSRTLDVMKFIFKGGKVESKKQNYDGIFICLKQIVGIKIHTFNLQTCNRQPTDRNGSYLVFDH